MLNFKSIVPFILVVISSNAQKDWVKTYKSMRNVSPPTGLNSNTRYREMMERDQDLIDEEHSR